jgi:hypothetical protein
VWWAAAHHAFVIGETMSDHKELKDQADQLAREHGVKFHVCEIENKGVAIFFNIFRDGDKDMKKEFKVIYTANPVVH